MEMKFGGEISTRQNFDKYHQKSAKFKTMQVKTLKNLIFALRGPKPLKNLIFAPSQPLRQLCSLLIIMHQIYIYIYI